MIADHVVGILIDGASLGIGHDAGLGERARIVPREAVQTISAGVVMDTLLVQRMAELGGFLRVQVPTTDRWELRRLDNLGVIEVKFRRLIGDRQLHGIQAVSELVLTHANVSMEVIAKRVVGEWLRAAERELAKA